MKRSKSILIAWLVSFATCACAQNISDFVEKNRDIRIVFYNCENLFDTQDDTTINDEDFLPEGKKHWTVDKYWKKQNQLAKVITSAGGWEFPDLVGVCEIENKRVLSDLVDKTPLSKAGYNIVHFNSPDRRGIDVGLLYLPKKFKPINSQAIEVINPQTPESRTRDILYVKGLTKKKDTLHVFINHWPSRWGGQLKSEFKRTYAASVLKKVTDSIQSSNSMANIVIMGDFNDEPENKSVKEVLMAQEVNETIKPKEGLYNISEYYQHSTKLGSHKYKGVWGMLDQCVISGSLLNGSEGLKTTLGDFTAFHAEFLLEEDDRYMGLQPSRTYRGMRFHGGYSDHLPIILDLKFVR